MTFAVTFVSTAHDERREFADDFEQFLWLQRRS